MGTKALLQGTIWASLVAALCIAGPTGSAVAAPPAPITVKPSGGDHTTIQAAIDAAAPGDTIHVYPGSYLETATNRWVLGTNGPHQFGLFIGQDKDWLKIVGVDAKGRVVRDWKAVAAHVTTDSTANFGPSGIFVEGDGVTISGLDIGVNLSGQNKTIEVIGDDFRLMDCDITDSWGSVYLNDWRFDELSDTSHVQRYRIERNNFRDGVSIDIASGAGYSGDVRHRIIRQNTFTNSYFWPSISFNGSDPDVGWFDYSVGGAVIKENSFVNTFIPTPPVEPGDLTIEEQLDREGHIRARGTYDNSQFDWKSWWLNNKYDAAYVVGPNPPKDVRAYSYGVFDDVRRIGALLEGEELHQEAGDKILSK